MTSAQWKLVQEAFAEAVEMSAVQRAVYLQSIGDGSLVAEVQRLLGLHELENNPVEQLLLSISLLKAAEQQHMFFPSEVLDGRYEIIRFLGSGGMGEVYEAEDRKSGDHIALKTLNPGLTNLAWLKREVQTARMVDHPNVCQVFDFVQSTLKNGTPIAFLTMELLEGETLRQRLQRQGAMTTHCALPLIRQITAGLTAAHRVGVIHRDLKPGNIMLVPRLEGGERLVITDFGLAREITLDRVATRTRTSLMAAGTPAYVSPEQMQGRKPGPAADIYSLGVVIFEMLTGELPHDDSSPLAMAAHKLQRPPRDPVSFSPSLNLLWVRTIRKCLMVEPRKRFATPRDVIAALEARTRWRLLWRLFLKRRQKVLTMAAVLAALVILLAVGVWAWPVDKSDEARRAWRDGVQTLHAGDAAAAVRIIDIASQQYRLPAAAHAHLAQAWVELGMPDRAKWAVWAGRLRRHTAGESRLLESVNAQLRGDAKGARAALEGQTEFAAELAFLVEKGSTAEGAVAWAKLLKMEPQNAAAMLRLALQEQDPEAEEHFLAAGTLFHARGNRDGERLVAAMRGVAALKQGNLAGAQMNFASMTASHPLGLGRGTCERSVTFTAGVPDHFELPLDPVEFVNKKVKGVPLRQFDEDGQDKFLEVSFPLPSVLICSIEVEALVRRLPGDQGAMNDAITAGTTGGPGAPVITMFIWSAATPTLTERTLNLGIVGKDLERFLSVVDWKAPTLDVSIQDETTVDYVRVTFVY